MATSLLANLASEETLNDTLANISYLLVGIMEKMPRIDSTDRQTVNVETGSIVISGVPTVTLGTMGAASPHAIPMHTANIGAAHIYNNIEIN